MGHCSPGVVHPERLGLLATPTVGPVAFVNHDGIQLVPLNFAVIADEIYFRTTVHRRATRARSLATTCTEGHWWLSVSRAARATSRTDDLPARATTSFARITSAAAPRARSASSVAGARACCRVTGPALAA